MRRRRQRSVNQNGLRSGCTRRGRPKIEVAPAIGLGIVELAVPSQAPVIGRRPANADHFLAASLFQRVLRRLERVERNDRVEVMRRVLHQAVEEQIDHFRKTDPHGAMKLLIGGRRPARGQRPFHVGSGVLDDRDEGDEEIPDEERDEQAEDRRVREGRAEALCAADVQRQPGQAGEKGYEPDIDERQIEIVSPGEGRALLRTRKEYVRDPDIDQIVEGLAEEAALEPVIGAAERRRGTIVVDGGTPNGSEDAARAEIRWCR